MLVTLRVVMPAGNVLKTKLIPVVEDATLLDKYVTPFVASCANNVAIEDVLAYSSIDNLDKKEGIDIDIDTFRHICGQDLSAFGSFLLIRCRPVEVAPPTTPAPLPSALQTLMRSAQSARTTASTLVLPPRCADNRYDFNIYNALLARIQEHHLGFASAHVDSAQKLLMATAKALNYLLPFDDAKSDEKPRGILYARGFHLPARLTTAGLGINKREHGHKEKPSDERLSCEKIEEHVDGIVRKLSNCLWVKLPMWNRTVGKEFIDDITSLCNSMTEKVNTMKKNVEQVQHAQSSSAPVRTPADSHNTNYSERAKAPLPTAAVYQPLNDAIGELGDDFMYQPVTVTDELIGIDPRSTVAVKQHARDKFVEKLRFQEGAVGVYVFTGGGPYPRHIQVWAIEQPVPPAQHAAALARANENIRQFATRQMKREFLSKLAPASIQPAVLRAIWNSVDLPILPDQSDTHEVDERVLQWLSQNEADSELYYDLRALNGADGDRFDAFWAEMAKYLALDVGEGAHERRAASSRETTFAPKVVSIPILIREVAERLHTQPGHENDRIPSAECVRLQFTPNRPTALVSKAFTGRFAMVRKVQTRCLRKWHEDALWCLAHHKYAKQQVVGARDVLLELGLADTVLPAHLDDKCKIPHGIPGVPVAAASRAHAGGGTHGMLAGQDEVISTADHDHYKQGSITPSVTLLGNVPDNAADSWYSGAIMVDLRDSVFEGSDPMLHMANLLEYVRERGLRQARSRQAVWTARQKAQIDKLETWLQREEEDVVLELVQEETNTRSYDEIRFEKLNELDAIESALEADAALEGNDLLEKWFLPLFIWITADGGADHNIQHLAVKLSLIAFSRCIGVAKLSALRGCPYQSYTLTCERAMSLLQLGIQHVALARGRMSEASEVLIASCSSMSDIREAAGLAGKRKPKVDASRRAKKSRHADAQDVASTGCAGRDADGDEESDQDSREEGQLEIDKILDARLNARSGRQEYLVRWTAEDEEDSWEPESALSQASMALAEFLAERVRKAEAATEAATAEREFAEKEAQQKLRTEWTAAVAVPIAQVKARFEQLELKGVRVVVPPTASPSTMAELHAALRDIDPAYDPRYRSKKDLTKMPVLKALLEDGKHCFDSTYALDVFDCGDPGCRFGCTNWQTRMKADCASRGCAEEQVDAAIKLLGERSTLPMANKKGDRFLSYAEAQKLSVTDERHLPSQHAAWEKVTRSEVRKMQVEADKAKEDTHGKRILHVSKVRAVIFCDNPSCKKPRILYSKNKPSPTLLTAMDAYAETISYQCGDPLFEEGMEDSPDNANLIKLKETFVVREAQTCKDPVERDFFNTGGVSGRTVFEYICSHCGADPDESPLVSDAVLGVAPDGKKLLPLCEDCHTQKVKPRSYGNADQSLARKQGTGAKRKDRTDRDAGRGRGRGRSRGRGGGRRGRGRGRGRGRSSVAAKGTSADSDESSEEEQHNGGGRPSKRARVAAESSSSPEVEESGEEEESSCSSPPEDSEEEDASEN